VLLAFSPCALPAYSIHISHTGLLAVPPIHKAYFCLRAFALAVPFFMECSSPE
jgi:hypothetical protein